MLVRRFSAAAAVLLSACAGEMVEPRPLSASLENGPSEFILTGAGHTDLPVSGDMRNFTFHARRNPDGSASGSYRVQRLDNGAWFTVRVTCMTVAGNTAWVGGIIDDTNVPNLVAVGRISYFYAIDGGEGAGTTDRISRARLNDAPGQDQAFCALQPLGLFDPNPLAVVEGNVQLR